MHQKYTSDTAKKTDDHSQLFELNKEMSKNIDRLVRQIATKKVNSYIICIYLIKAKIDLMKLKIL